MLSMFFTTAVGVVVLPSALLTVPVSPGWFLPVMGHVPVIGDVDAELGLTKLK